MTVADWEEDNGYFLVRHQNMTDVLVVKRRSIEVVEDEDTTRLDNGGKEKRDRFHVGRWSHKSSGRKTL